MKRPALATALLLSATLALSGCGALFGPERAPRDEDGTINKEADADAFTIRNGDCLNDPGEGDIESVPVVPCSTPHEFEVFHEFTLKEATYPKTDDAMLEIVGPKCETAFQGFVGRDIDDSRLDFTTLEPSELSWKDGDRTVQCLIGDPEKGKTTGSLAGANL
ncbi:septum formation family protein [Paeniglutamicibacter sp. R2-26]|uniref:septum formation family protein n=1 Tax=Paeniglutamicibacter sp. R2-26 TaxID=3144417 RepID=UPI003EE6EE25